MPVASRRNLQPGCHLFSKCVDTSKGDSVNISCQHKRDVYKRKHRPNNKDWMLLDVEYFLNTITCIEIVLLHASSVKYYRFGHHDPGCPITAHSRGNSLDATSIPVQNNG